ncbi:TPA: hypothetical protein RXM13_001102 [Campylobacter coli]|nr:hypothetical protein [Campylobacter coli]
MNSIKVKLSFIANLIAVFALIVLGVVSFYFTETSLHEATLREQTNLLKATENVIDDYKAQNSAIVENLAKDILSLPYESLNSQEDLIQNVGVTLKDYRHTINALAAYIGQSSGENIVSDDISDKEGVSVKINGKANGYNATTRDWYKDTVNANSVVVSPPYIDAVTKEFVIT